MHVEFLLRQRQTAIQDQLRRSGRVLAADLAREFHVSEDTIRRDLREMAASGLCERVYGGALALSPMASSLAQRLEVNTHGKDALARAAVRLIVPGTTVFLDAGSTNLAIARALPPEIELTVATNTPLIAAALMDRPGIDLILIGGRIDRQAGAAVGAKAQRDVEVLRPDLCVLGTCGADAIAGLTAFGYEDAEFKRFVARRSAKVLAAVTNEKLGLSASHAVVTLAECSTLVVEFDAPESSVADCEKAGVEVVRAKETKA